MVDRQRGVAGRELRDAGQRNLPAGIRLDVNLVQRSRVQLILRINLEDDVVLVVLLVQRRDLPLAEGVVQRVVDRLRRNAEPGRRVAVDDEISLQAARLQVAIDVGQFRTLAELVDQPGRPVIKRVEIGGLQRVLILGTAEAATDPDVLNGLQIQRDSRHRRQFSAQTGDDRIGAHFADAERLERDEHASVIDGRSATAAANERPDGIHRWIG